MNTTSRILGEAMTPYQKRIYKNPAKAYRWALNNSQLFPEAEPYIATDPKSAIMYLLHVRGSKGGRWPEAEPYILTNASSAFSYASGFIRGRWIEAEPIIATDPLCACLYASQVLNHRWPEVEQAIAADKTATTCYLNKFPEARVDWLIHGLSTDWLGRCVV